MPSLSQQQQPDYGGGCVVFLIISSEVQAHSRACIEAWNYWIEVVHQCSAYSDWHIVHLRNNTGKVAAAKSGGGAHCWSEANHTLWCPGAESYWPGIFQKTMVGLRFALKQWPGAQTIVRTNLSSVWLPDSLRRVRDTLLPRTNCYAGWVYGPVDPRRYQYISGSGIVLSRDVAQRLADHDLSQAGGDAQLTRKVMTEYDDVVIGDIVHGYGVPITNLHTPVHLFESQAIKNDARSADWCAFASTLQRPHHLYVRLRCRNRSKEGEWFRHITDTHLDLPIAIADENPTTAVIDGDGRGTWRQRLARKLRRIRNKRLRRARNNTKLPKQSEQQQQETMTMELLLYRRALANKLRNIRLKRERRRNRGA